LVWESQYFSWLETRHEHTACGSTLDCSDLNHPRTVTQDTDTTGTWSRLKQVSTSTFYSAQDARSIEKHK
jgi:hypothetical protein